MLRPFGRRASRDSCKERECTVQRALRSDSRGITLALNQLSMIELQKYQIFFFNPIKFRIRD